MKTSAPLLLLLLPSAALAVRVDPLPFDASEDAISEVSTNVPFAVGFKAMSRIEITLTLDASPTNVVEVSVGTDADGDGALGLDEVSWTFGSDCGRWFCRDAARDRQAEEECLSPVVSAGEHNKTLPTALTPCYLLLTTFLSWR